ncbi:head GIN domain-containing protein [Spongiivirga citrea]|uniref:Putative auto-transporter adhesin head GIN domain-containing protein n=1 Tax=Spongiivirga citrea TaxID=1481457 RepID=A0A6M0CKW7_9FLAO|nr:head GIN domain-containing protein [Spongiivirga citrea]NER16634.1 hypothetical protein [Spongiivirga citrea]
MKLSNFSLFICALLFSFNTQAQKITNLSRSTSTKTFEFDNYDAIDVSDDFKLTVSFSSKNSPITVEANDNIIQYVDVYKEGSTLYFRLKKRLGYTSWRGNLILRASLTTTNIDAFYVSSDATVELTNTLSNSNLSLNIKGDGVFNGKLNVDNFELNAKSDAQVNILGKVATMKAYLSSDAQLKARDLVVNDLEIELKSDSQARIQVRNTIDAYATSDASLRYLGNPKVLRSKATGDAHIRSM